jgi:hypothetical protein
MYARVSVPRVGFARCGVFMHDKLFQCEEFGFAAPDTPTVFYVCPYSAPIQRVRFSIRWLVRAGYHVVAYQTDDAVFQAADPAILPELILQVREDIKDRVAKLEVAGVTDFGFFGSSLGSFILYNCVGREVPQFRWGVFNTGGNIARGLWKMEALQRAHVAGGWTLERLEEAWAGLQWPDFGPLDGCRFLFTSSRRDQVAPMGEISTYLKPMLEAGAGVRVQELPAWSHRSTVIVGLLEAPRLVRMARPAQPARRVARRLRDRHRDRGCRGHRPRSSSAPSSSPGVSTCGRWPVPGSSVNTDDGMAAA